MSATVDLSEGRYDRQELLTWWDQGRLERASVLVVGAGALGNEIAKNLALVGVGRIVLIDMDHIELSNLARCVLFRDPDAGRPKAEVAAEAVAVLNPTVTVEGIVADIRSLGLGWWRQFDVVIGGLDNRAARAWVNQAARKLGTPWIDGAIEGLRGVARTFMPEGACYECTLGEVDQRILAQRKSCALLTVDEMLTGHVPTTATTSSVIAAIQSQEAIKLIVGRQDLLALCNRAFVFYGETLETYHVDYGEDPECLAHDRYETITAAPYRPVTTLRDLIGDAGADGFAVADFEHDLIVAGHCAGCDVRRAIHRFAPAVTDAQARCPQCGELFGFDTTVSVASDSELWDVALRDLGTADQEVVTVRTADRRVHLVLEPA